MSEEKNQNEIEEVTNEDEHKDVEHYCYLCRRPESVAGKMLELPNNIFICTDCMQRTLNSMGNGQFGFIDARNMDLDSMDITKMMNDMQSMQPKAEVKKKKKDKKEEPEFTLKDIPAPHRSRRCWMNMLLDRIMRRKSCLLLYTIIINEWLQTQWMRSKSINRIC